MTIRFGLLTLSDRSSQAKRADLSGPALAKLIETQNWSITKQTILPDEEDEIRTLLIEWTDSREFDIILTTGGTGFAPRDVTPEATRSVIQREAPGLTEVMRMESYKKTPHAMLSRSVAGIRGHTLIINLPGNPKAAVENFQSIIPILVHAVQLLNDDPASESSH
jgi:molybdopterin adenylyltransferase